MIKLTIDNQPIEVPVDTTVLKAAEKLGISIPTMCFYNDSFSNHPSCMVCMVKDLHSGKEFASCAMPVKEGMEIITNNQEIRAARREALELLLSDHVGDCEAPCRTACPAFMDIPRMNRLIAKGNFTEALKIVKQEIALPMVLGYVCQAPCEKACRRNDADNSVSICELKKFTGLEDAFSESPYMPDKAPDKEEKIAIIGSGPAGLAAAYEFLKEGYLVDIFEKSNKAGDAFRNRTTEEELPRKILDKEIQLIEQYGAKIHLNQNIDFDKLIKEIKPQHEAVLLSTGKTDEPFIHNNNLETNSKGIKVDHETWETSVSGVYSCGSAVKEHKMAIRALANGKEAARAIHRKLRRIQIDNTKPFNSRFGRLQTEEIQEYLKESTNIDRLEPNSKELKAFTKEEAQKEAERCMRCDCRKPDTCKLRILAGEYNADRRKYLFGERKLIQKYFQHENVIYEPEKCIRCGLCIEIAEKSGENTGLAPIGRGFDVRVKTPFNKDLSEALTHSAKEIVEACPTGALAFKK